MSKRRDPPKSALVRDRRPRSRGQVALGGLAVRVNAERRNLDGLLASLDEQPLFSPRGAAPGDSLSEQARADLSAVEVPASLTQGIEQRPPRRRDGPSVGLADARIGGGVCKRRPRDTRGPGGSRPFVFWCKGK